MAAVEARAGKEGKQARPVQTTMLTLSLTNTSFTSPTHRYPHVLGGVIAVAPDATLLKFRLVSRATKERADAHFAGATNSCLPTRPSHHISAV
jgi:hypothetical protein